MKTTGQNRFSQRPTSVAAVSLAAGVLLSSSPLAIGQTLTPAFTSFPAALKSKITHVIVIFPENRSFDSLYGSFPGANGLNSTNYTQQYTRSSGVALTNLIAPNLNGLQLIGNNNADPRFPSTMPNHPVDISTAVPDAYFHGDLTHLFYLEQYQINNPAYGIYGDPKNAGGPTLSKFTVWSSNPGLVLSHYDEQNGGEGALAKQYVLADNAFHSAFGGSFLNHQWLIAARTPIWPASPTEGAAAPGGAAVTPVDPASTWSTNNPSGQWFPKANGTDLGYGKQLSDNALTPDPTLPGFPYSNVNTNLNSGDYWAVNTLRPLRGPSGGFAVPATAPFYGFPQDGTPTTTTLNITTNNNGTNVFAASLILPPVSYSAYNTLLPLQTHDTIGDRLNSAPGGAISWAWFSGGWNAAKAGRADFLFQFHHQPFAFFAKYALASAPTWGIPGSTNLAVAGVDSVDLGESRIGYGVGSKNHLLDEDTDFYAQLAAGTLPQVSFVKPIGEDNSHPGYASVKRGQSWVANIVAKIKGSPLWPNTAIFVFYDEHGGLYDHVQPPVIDRWGPGTRVPFLIISPWSKKGFVDHNQYETVSVLSFIEQLFNVAPLNTRDANALPPVAAFQGEPDLFVEATAGAWVNYQVPAYNSPVSYAVTSGTLPHNLTLNPTTGQITGIPSSAGTTTVTVTVTGSTVGLQPGQQNTLTYKVQIDVH